MTATYTDFLAEKVNFRNGCGFSIDEGEINPLLLPHQAAIVKWAVAGGRRAIFAAFGLGKTFMQLEAVRLVIEHRGGCGLIVLPLGVRQEFIRDAATLGIRVKFIRRTDEIAGQQIYLTNYESIRDGKLDPNAFTVASLDEASVLRSFGSKTYQTFLTLFDDVPYRFVATATPSPNRYKELIHYAGFLGVMDTGQALTRFFQRDSTQANNLTLYPHKTREFWLWLSTWAVFLQKPSDLGYSDDGYDLPDIDVVHHVVQVDHSTAQVERDGQARLFRGGQLGVSDAAREKRDTLAARVAQVMEVVDDHVRAAEGLQQGLLRTEPRTADRGTASTNAGDRSGPARPPAEGVLPGQQGAPARRAAGEGTAELPSQSSELCAASAPNPAGEVRPGRGDIQPHADRAVGEVRDLQRADDAAGGGPRPRDRSRQGTAVPAVQHSDRPAAGVPDGTLRGDRVPDQIVIWCDLNVEQRGIEQALRDRGLTYSSIDGVELVGQADEDGHVRLLEVEPLPEHDGLANQGVGLSVAPGGESAFGLVKLQGAAFIQALHRTHRFGQTRPCTAHLIYAESEADVVRVLMQKWAQHKELTNAMTDVIREHGLNDLSVTEALTRSIGIDRVEAAGDGWLVACNDCVDETTGMADNSVDLIVTSIPFSNHYEYTPSYNDFGHTDNNDHFWAQMDYLTPQLHRVLAPGRIYACHVKDRILFGSVTGAGVPTVSPFHAEAIFHARKHGFDYLGMRTVVTDVVRENNQTYRLGWTEMSKDATKMGSGSPEYILLFHKPQTDRSRGYADTPVTKDKAQYSRARWQVDAHAYWRSSGNRPLTPDELAALPVEQRSRLFTEHSLDEVYDYESHVRIGEILDQRGALPSTFMSLAPGSWHKDVWHDVNRMLTLNTEQSRRAQAMHVCPLQFDIVDRLIALYSNPGDLVYDPFGGLFTVPVRAIMAGRRGRAAELNGGYFFDGVKYLQAAERDRSMPSLFDLEASA